MGREDYQEFDEFIQLYDSIVAIRSDTIVSKNLVDESDWIFTINGDDSAEYQLVIDENDFQELEPSWRPFVTQGIRI